MKTRLFLCIFFLFLIGGIAEVYTETGRDQIGLVWDPNPESDLCYYTIYWGQESRVYFSSEEVGNPLVGTTPDDSCMVMLDITEWQEGTWFFAVTASDEYGNESDYSNEVSWTIDHTPPSPPGGCRTIRIQ